MPYYLPFNFCMNKRLQSEPGKTEDRSSLEYKMLCVQQSIL